MKYLKSFPEENILECMIRKGCKKTGHADRFLFQVLTSQKSKHPRKHVTYFNQGQNQTS